MELIELRVLEATTPVNPVTAEVSHLRLHMLPTPKALSEQSLELLWKEMGESRKMSPELEQIRVAPPPINPEIIKQPDRSAPPAELSILQRQATEREDEYLAQVRRERVAKLEQKAREAAARDARIAATEVREKAVESEAAKIATTQIELWKTYQAADAADRAHRELEPRGMSEILGESKRHRVWVCERNELSREAIRLWEQCGGDMSAPDKGEAEVVRRLTPEFARSEAEKVVEAAERRELAEREKREAQERTEAAAIEAQAREKKRESGYTLPLKVDPDKRVALIVGVGDNKREVIGKIVDITKKGIVLKIGANSYTFTFVRDKILDICPAPEQPRSGRESETQQRSTSRWLGR